MNEPERQRGERLARRLRYRAWGLASSGVVLLAIGAIYGYGAAAVFRASGGSRAFRMTLLVILAALCGGIAGYLFRLAGVALDVAAETLNRKR